ncbi:unnamed protein product [Rhizoctonia solani]|uniref:Uncharacterized protein n=1 Tax=Rhizoctonia solani TaxID=456999 RepID=A0A8H3A0A8_9AGAM|nr:unnamed protein product [Rhizoctonia solani]
MASNTFTIEIDLINKNKPQVVDALAVDRSILKDHDLAYIFDLLPTQTEARIDQPSSRPYVGIDLFYGKDANVKGLVFVTQSRALIVRVPDNAAKTSAARYEKKLIEKPDNKPIPATRIKGQKPTKLTPERTPYERLRQLLDANLVAFGMAQITLTLWDTLRERVEGINLSTILSKPEPPAPRFIPDPNAPLEDDDSGKNSKGEGGNGRRKQGNGGSGERGGHRGRGSKSDRGGRGRGRGRGGRSNSNKGGDENPNSVKGPKMTRVELPEDKADCWDREILSPGIVVKALYHDVSPMDINAVFIGGEDDADMLGRVAEAISRAWVAYIVANHNEIRLAIQGAPVIKPSRLNDEELTFFSKSMVAAWMVMGEGEAQRLIEKEDMKLGRTNELENQSHKKRIRASEHQEVRIKTKDGDIKTLYPRRVKDNAKAIKLTEDELPPKEDPPKNKSRTEHNEHKGRKNGHRQTVFKDLVGGPDAFNTGSFDDEEADLKEQPLFDMENVESFKVYGRAESTMSEKGRDKFVLSLLEGRGALRGPDYEDCEFIRRVWFPNRVQSETGKKREAKNATPAVKERYDWVEDSWGDDTDEEEAASALKNKIPDSELIDYDTEDDELGDDLKLSEVERLVPKLKNRINPSQLKVIGRVTAPNPKGRTRATLVHGPPGTGKTSTITAATIRLVKSGEYVWIVAQSNVGISNVAGKLLDIDFTDFILIVSEEYFVWSPEQYTQLEPYLIRTNQLFSRVKRFKGKKLVLCTLAALSNPLVEDLVMSQYVPLRHLIIDEASQIDMTSQFMHLFFKHRYALKNVCWFGDPKQLPPYGWSESVQINDIFKVNHLQANSKLMDTSYRLPVPIAEFISKNVYKGELKASPFHKVKTPTDAILFVDTPKGMEEGEPGGTSSLNVVEADTIVRIVELYYHKEAGDGEPYEFDIITPYDAQRRLIEKKLKETGIDKEVYNVDSFQGREADYIITSLTKTTFSSFLTSVNRLNVLLTRCKKGLVVVTQKEFVTRTGGLLRGLWWEYENHDIWKDADEVVNGYIDLPGSPAPAERPEEGEQDSSESD